MPMKSIVTSFFKDPIYEFSEMEQKLCIDYYMNMLVQRKSGAEGAVGYFMTNVSFSKHPTGGFLEEMVTNSGYEFCFMYGADDWIDFTCTKRRIDEAAKGEKISFNVIEGTGHMLIFDSKHRAVTDIMQDWYKDYQKRHVGAPPVSSKGSPVKIQNTLRDENVNDTNHET
jgi:hypothetical protein